jgi:hypothetical protein
MSDRRTRRLRDAVELAARRSDQEQKPNLSAPQSEKVWNESQSTKLPFRSRNFEAAEMAESLLGGCRESILEIAATQPVDGKQQF